jgi:hypothetical protein
VEVEVEVLVADDHRESIDEVAAALTDAGLRDTSPLHGVGVITGSVGDRTGIDALRAVEGVDDVREGREVRIPPPDEPVQ